MRVEFRLLQLLLSHDSGDRLTLALLHWDGAQLRVASSMSPLGVLDVLDREPMRATAREWVRRAEATAARLRTEQSEVNPGLATLFPVRAGIGASLMWTSVTTVEAHDAESHFDELRSSLRLDRPRPGRHRRVTESVLRHQLEALGESLVERLGAPTRLRIGQTVEAGLKYTPPVSWKNGLWHHAIPVSFDGLEPTQVEEQVERLHGVVCLAIPKGEAPMIVAALPPAGPNADLVAHARELLAPLLGERRGAWIAPAHTRGSFELGELEERIRRDVTHDGE